MTDPCYSCGAAVRLDHAILAGGIVETRVCTNPTCETNADPRTDTTPLP